MGELDINSNVAHGSDYKTYWKGSQGEPLIVQDLSENLDELVVPEKLNRYTSPAPRLPRVDVNTHVTSTNVRLTALEPVSLAPSGSLTLISQFAGAEPSLCTHTKVSNLPSSTRDQTTAVRFVTARMLLEPPEGDGPALSPDWTAFGLRRVGLGAGFGECSPKPST
jgi:hypothetical protein